MSQRADKALWREGGSLALDRVSAAFRSSSPIRPKAFFIQEISASQFYNNVKQISALCRKNKLRIEYYSQECLLVLQAMPSPIHDCIQSWMDCEVQRMRKKGFIRSRHWSGCISINYSMDFRDFRGAYEGSWKSPDVSVISFGQSLPNLVIEVAFSESSEHARRKADFWLNAASDTLQVVVLILVDETEARRRAPGDGSEVEVPNTDDLASDDDLWVGELQISLELWRRNLGGVYRQREIRLADVTSVDSAKEHAARIAHHSYDDDESSSSAESDDGLNEPTFVLKITDFFGRGPIPSSYDPLSTFTMRTDTLRAYITRYRRLLGRNRRVEARSRARARLGYDSPYVDEP